MVLLEDIYHAEGRVEDRHMAVIAFLAGSTQVGPALSHSVGELGMSLSSPTATVLSRLARASAAALTGEESRRVLRSRLAAAPLDQACLSDLLDSYPTEEARARTEECIRLVQIDPRTVERLAREKLGLARTNETVIRFETPKR